MTATAKTTPKAPPWQTGAEAIRKAAKQLPQSPGVYQMCDSSGRVLYVGKARRLQNRVMSYTHTGRLTKRICRMVARTRSVRVEHTHTGAEALLLEMSLIKTLRPPYNILLRDGKSFPFLQMDSSQPFARLQVYRGRRKSGQQHLFGPFASSKSVYTAMETMQKAFLLRVCSDHVFEQRTRPCLLYQIKRCSAPCVNKIDARNYGRLTSQAKAFLRGKSQEIQKSLAREMEDASNRQEYELAAELRDRIAALTAVQAHQRVSLDTLPNVDVVVIQQVASLAIMRVMIYRNGMLNGTRDDFMSTDTQDTDTQDDTRDIRSGANHQMLLSFLARLYERYPPPPWILTNADWQDSDDLESALSQLAGHRVRISRPQRGVRKALLDFALENLEQTIRQRQAQMASHVEMLEKLQQRLKLPRMPRRIEVYDNSHLQGSQPVGAMIVMTENGFEKGAYRRFAVRGEPGKHGDDYGMMAEVLQRRLQHLPPAPDESATSDHTHSLNQPNAATPTDASWARPDLILLDGGVGQLAVGERVLQAMNISNISLAAISKGPDRRAGEDKIHRPGWPQPLEIPRHDPLLLFLQAIRDEAHRFVLQFHRQRRTRLMSDNPLDNIPGIGRKRRRSLMLHFGTARAVMDAGIDDLAAVDGISGAIATRIYQHFNAQ